MPLSANIAHSDVVIGLHHKDTRASAVIPIAGGTSKVIIQNGEGAVATDYEAKIGNCVIFQDSNFAYTSITNGGTCLVRLDDSGTHTVCDSTKDYSILDIWLFSTQKLLFPFYDSIILQDTDILACLILLAHFLENKNLPSLIYRD